MALMHAANKYSITEITQKCGDFLKTQIKAENICTILETSMRYDERSLTERCLEFIWQNATDVLTSSDFSNLSYTALMKVVESDKLRLGEHETIVYTACVKWADAECGRKQIEATDNNRREVLADVLFQIRFPTMTHVQLAEITNGSDLLTDNECRKILEHTILHGNDDTRCQCQLKFNKKQRIGPREITVSRFSPSNIKHGWWTLTTYNVVNAVDVETNKSCLIEGVGMFGGDSACNRNVTLKLLDNNGSVLSTTSKTVYTDGTKTPVRVDLPQPVTISAGKRYSVVATIDGQNTYYGEQGSVRVEDAGLVIALHDSSHGMYYSQPHADFGRAQRGQIPELYFIVR